MTIFTDLISNVALLLALSILYSFLTRIWKQGEMPGQILTGILFGGVAVAGMILPFRYGPGLIFDGRSIVVSMAGLFGGPVTAVISTLIAGGYRLGLGGTGAFTGFLVILTSAVLGVGYHYLRLKNPDIIKTHYLLVFGVIVHISMLLCMLTLPWTVALEVLDRISISVMLIFPFGTVFLGALLADQEKRNYAQEALRESEGKYRQIIEGATDVIFTTDYQGYCAYVNVPGEKLTGYTVDELVGMHFTELISVDWRERVQLLYIKQFQGREEKTRMEFPIITKTGEEKWVDQIVTILTEGNKITGFQSIVRDITDRKFAEETLRENEEKYRTILENMEEGYYEVDLAGNFTFVNDAMSEIRGYSREELMGKNNRDYMTEETAKEVFKVYNNVYTTGKPARNLEWETIRKDGTKGRVETSASLIKDSKGKPIGFRGVMRDISEKQILEAQLHKAQKMESIGTLAGGIAHNFNNLLMGIQGNASIILLDIDSGNPRHKNLKNIEKLVDNGAKLAAQLIAYAREGKYEVKPINLNQLVKETSDTFGMTKKEISIHQKLSEKLYGIKADQGQIEQVLLNLYVNAADAMPGGGVLFVKTINVTDKDITDKLYETKLGNYVLLTVKDTGVGMDKETRERIFEPFFTTKGLASGTGLGLASVYGIIKSHGGYIDVDSEKGKGTTFSIYLPATEEIIEQKNVLSDELVKGKGTILLVDDEEMVLESGEHMLKHLGYEVLLANDGQEALELYKLNQDKIDLVLLDMVMPVMGGGEAFDRMKEINTNVKVLLSSGYSIEGEAKEILNRGCDAFIQKPFKLEHFSQKIKKLLGNK